MDIENVIVPTYLQEFVRVNKNNNLIEMVMCTPSGNELLEVWYYGDLLQVGGEKHPYIIDTKVAPLKIIAKDPQEGKEILVFDGAKHGYDNMFCDSYSIEQIENRPLKRLDIPATKLILSLQYGIDYEDEKDDWEIDKNGNVSLIDGTKIPWEDVKRNGFDWFSLLFIDKDGQAIQFVDRELA